MNFNATYGMASPVFTAVAYDVLRSVGSKDAVVKLSVGADSAMLHGGDPHAIFHDGSIARAQLTETDKARDSEIAELRAALLVVATEDGGLAGKMEAALNKLGEVALHLGQTAMSPKVMAAFAHAYPFMEVAGDVVLAWQLLWRANLAAQKLEKGAKKKERLRGD